MYLLDTNIFLEILLNQEQKLACKEFINNNPDNLNISDFSLHSIGVILFRQNKAAAFSKFVSDILPIIKSKTLSVHGYGNLQLVRKNMNLDFDDSYQYLIAKENDLALVTMDKHFENIQGIKVLNI